MAGDIKNSCRGTSSDPAFRRVADGGCKNRKGKEVLQFHTYHDEESIENRYKRTHSFAGSIVLD